jgi:anthranilate synthase component I
VRRYFPNLDEFSAVAKSATIVPVYRQLLADRLTPVTAFEVLGREQHAFLLESVIGGERTSPCIQICTGRVYANFFRGQE